MGIPLIVQPDHFPWFLCVCNMHNWSVWWLGLMYCRCAGWQPSGTHDTPLISCVYLPVWETVAVGQNMKGVCLSAYMVCVCVCLCVCPCSSYGKRRLWPSPFISSLITVPTGKAAQKSLSNANSLSLLAHNTHRLAVSHSPFTVCLPRVRLPAPNTHTQPARLTVSQGDQTVDS